jgi:hypothetical protein
MHRVIRDHLEEILADSQPDRQQDYQLHLENCEDCREQIAAMRKHSAAMRELRSDADARPGFYARVMERIETQRPGSIWNVFSDSPFGRRIAIASMALAALLGIYLVTTEEYVDLSSPSQMISATLPAEDQPAMVLGSGEAPNRDAVLVNLVTYREQ